MVCLATLSAADSRFSGSARFLNCTLHFLRLSMGVRADGTYPCRSFYVWPLAAQFQAGRFDPYLFSILKEVAHAMNLSRVKLHPIRVVSDIN